MAQEGIPYPIRLGQQGQVNRQHRWLTVSGDLEIAENVVFEHDILQVQPAALVYDIGEFADSIHYDFGASQTSVADGVRIIVDPVVSLEELNVPVVSAAASSPGTTWVLTLSANVLASQAIVLGFGYVNGAAMSITGITDSKGNTWTRLTTAAGDSGTFQTSIWMSVLTTTLLLGGADTITVTFSANPTRVLVRGGSWRGLTTTLDDWARVASATHAGDFFVDFWRHRAVSYLDFYVTLWDSTLNAITWHGTTDGGTVTGAAHRLSIGSDITRPFLILAQTAWDSDALATGAATADTTYGSTVVTGAGGKNAGELTINGETHTVDDDTGFTTTTPWRQTLLNQVYQTRAPSMLVTVFTDYNAGTQAGTVYKSAADVVTTNPNTGFLRDDTLVTNLAVDMRHPRLIAAGKETAGADKKLFLVNGIDPVKVLAGDGTVMNTIATPAADWGSAQNAHTQPINGIVHRNQLILFGNWNDPHRLYFADPANHEVFQGGDATTMRVASQIGKRLYGAAEYQGILYVWKYPKGIFYLDDTDVDFVNWAYHIRSDTLGCAPNPYTVLGIDNDVIFMAPDGHIHRLSAVNTLGGTADSDLTLALGLDDWTRTTLDLTRFDTVCSVYDPRTRTAYFGCKSQANRSFRNDLLLQFDFALVDRGGPVRFSYATVWTPNSLCLFRRDVEGEPALMIGEANTSFFVIPGANGAVVDRLPGQGESAAEVIPFPHRVRTAAYDFGDQDEKNRPKWKHFRLLVLSWQQKPDTVIVANCYVDGVLRQSFPVPRTEDSQISLTCGRGRTFALEIVSADASEPRYLAFTVYYELGGESASVSE